MKKLFIYEFQAKQIEDTFRIVSRTLQSKDKETCLDRDVMVSWEMIQNVIKGDIDKHIERLKIVDLDKSTDNKPFLKVFLDWVLKWKETKSVMPYFEDVLVEFKNSDEYKNFAKSINEVVLESEKPTVIEVFNDDGTHSHYALVSSTTGEKLWSENPIECKAQGYPVKQN
jgi:hypothetical protein